MSASVWGLAVGLAVASVTTGLLRSFHDRLPRVDSLPWGAASPLLWIVVALVAWHLVQRAQKRDLYPPRQTGGVGVAHVVPLLAVLVAEKWTSGEALEGVYRLVDRWQTSAARQDALVRLIGGAALLLLALALVTLLRPTLRRLRRSLTRARLIEAFWLTVPALVVAASPLLLVELLTDAPLGVSVPRNALGLTIAAQITRGVGEELFFRGVLQITVVGLLLLAGMPEGRLPRIIGIVIVSLGFAVEHLDPSADLRQGASALLFVFLISCMLGALLESSRNLYLAMIAHAGVNLCVAELVPMPRDVEGAVLLPGSVVALLLLIALFTAVTLRHRVNRP